MSSTDPILTIYDTFSGKKRPLELREPGKCGIYCCGPTVYDMSHIGHARAALVPDILARFLRDAGIDVHYVRNVTDIDDKIIKRAQETNADPSAIATRFTDEYHRDLDAMNVQRPDSEPRVTEHIDEIIDLIGQLADKGLAYDVDGDVYFSVADFEPYGGLSKRDVEELKAGARVEVDERKRSPADFALWKSAKPGEPAWDSPWGRGRPGWHIECSAMAEKHLGQTFDIHAGGRDLIFPHHENEIAQSQGAHGEGTYARYWLHNGFVNFAGEKMSKSLGNFFTIREVTALYDPEVLRYFLIGVHYRSGVNFDVEVTCPKCDAKLDAEAQNQAKCPSCGHQSTADELKTRVRFPGLEEADERVAYIYETLRGAKAFVEQTQADPEGEVPQPVAGMLERFISAMRDDLNTAAALAATSEPLAVVNRLLASAKGVDKAERKRTIARFVRDFARIASILGIFGSAPEAWLTARRDLEARRIGLDVQRVESLIAARNEARANKDWARADELRDELAGLGVELRDAAGQTTWTL